MAGIRWLLEPAESSLLNRMGAKTVSGAKEHCISHLPPLNP